MPQYPEFMDPFDKNWADVFVRAEHLARYLYAAEYVHKHRLRTVLDAACGDGYGCRAMAAQAESVMGVDRNAALIERGKRRDAELSIGNISYHAADLNGGLAFLADGSFDCAACFETLEHVERDEELLTELRRVLRRGGRLLLSAPKAGYEPEDAEGRPANPYHVRLYDADGLRALLKRAGFQVEKTLGQPYTNICRVNMADYCRDKGMSIGQTDGFFCDTPEAMECYARLWGRPVAEAQEKSNVLFLICSRKG